MCHVSEHRAMTGGGQGLNITYPANLHQLSDHDDAETVLLPHHPPKVIQSLLLGSCWEDERNKSEGQTAASKPLGTGILIAGKSCIIATQLSFSPTARYRSLKIQPSMELLGIEGRKCDRKPALAYDESLKENLYLSCEGRHIQEARSNSKKRITWEINA